MPDDQQLASLKIDRSVSRRRSGPWILMTLLLVLAMGALAGWLLWPTPLPEVRTAVAREVRSGAESTVLNASGYVSARRAATVSSKVTGRIIEVLIEEGMAVAENQLMARLDDSNVAVNLRLAESELEAARSAVDETEVLLHEADLTLRRTRELVARKVLSQADLDRAQAEVDSLQARLAQQRDQIVVAERRIALWQQELDDREIRAPFAGVVVSKDAQPGEMISPVSAGGGFTRTGVATIVDMSSLEIEVDVSEAYINRVDTGQPVEAVLDAYPDWRIPARVIAIVPTADRQRATVKVRIGFEELDPRILPDMGVKVAFRDTAVESTASTGISIPAAALRREGDRDVVLVVRDGVVERRAVTVGRTSGGEALIVSGLTAGERVVIEGPETLTDGAEVRNTTR